MTNTGKLALVAATALLGVALWAGTGGAATKSSTTTVAGGAEGSSSVKCPKGQRVVAANVRGEETASPGPRVLVDSLARPGKRNVEVHAYNFGEPGDLTAIARCKQGPKSKLESATATVEAATIDAFGSGTATARCPRGKRIVFGGFRAERDADAPDYIHIFVTSAMREGGKRWTVEGANVSPDGSGTIEALAYCGDVDKAKTRTATIAQDAFEPGSVEARCPKGTKVAYGGFDGGDPNETFGVPYLNALERIGSRKFRVTSEAIGYFTGTVDLTAIAYCR